MSKIDITKLDVAQIQKREHDEAHSAKRVKITDTEMNMELSHADGDSVTSHPAKLSAMAFGCDAEDNGTIIIPPIDCSSLRVISVDVQGSGSVDVEVSLSDTEDSWRSLGQFDDFRDICARRIRVKSINADGNVHLCGRS